MDPAAQGLDLIPRGLTNAGAGLQGQPPDGRQDLFNQDISQQRRKYRHHGQGRQGKGVDEPGLGLALGAGPGDGIFMHQFIAVAQGQQVQKLPAQFQVPLESRFPIPFPV